MLYMLRLILLVGILVGTGVRAEEYDLSGAADMMEKARQDAAKMTLPVNKHAEEGMKAARETADFYNSPEFQDRLQCEQQRLEEEVFQEHTVSWKKKRAQQEKNEAGILGDSETVYLFLSSSIPDETVHNYLADIAGTGEAKVIPVMRGLVAGLGDMSATAGYFSRVLKEDPDCQDTVEPCRRHQVAIKIKPALFTQYGINRVPAVVYDDGKNVFVIQGDAGLDYFLEQINREAESASLTGLIKKMRGGS